MEVSKNILNKWDINNAPICKFEQYENCGIKKIGTNDFRNLIKYDNSFSILNKKKNWKYEIINVPAVANKKDNVYLKIGICSGNINNTVDRSYENITLENDNIVILSSGSSNNIQNIGSIFEVSVEKIDNNIIVKFIDTSTEECYFSQTISLLEYNIKEIYPCVSIYSKSCTVNIYCQQDIKFKDKKYSFENIIDNIIKTNINKENEYDENYFENLQNKISEISLIIKNHELKINKIDTEMVETKNNNSDENINILKEQIYKNQLEQLTKFIKLEEQLNNAQTEQLSKFIKLEEQLNNNQLEQNNRIIKLEEQLNNDSEKNASLNKSEEQLNNLLKKIEIAENKLNNINLDKIINYEKDLANLNEFYKKKIISLEEKIQNLYQHLRSLGK